MTDSQPNDTKNSHYFALLKGVMLHEFQIESVLGHGGFGITYRAFDTFLQEHVAIKEYLPNDLAIRAGDETVRPKSGGDQENFKSGLEMFLEEARIIARFAHPNIMKVKRFFEMNGTGYLVLQYERGGTLADRLNNGLPSMSELRTLLSGVLNGLDALHTRGILHRDLKPSNIIIREDGTPVLIDLGAARDFTSRHSRSVTAITAPGYSPPEQYGIGGQQGPWTDFYALGAILYKCVTGAAPSDSLRRLRKDPVIPAKVAMAGRFDDPFLSTIDWMLTIDEAQRPQSVQELLAALEGNGASSNQPASDVIKAVGIKGLVRRSDRVLLQLASSVDCDILEVSLFAISSKSYVATGKGGSPLSRDPQFHSLDRSDTADTFEINRDVSEKIVGGSEVRIASRDGLVEGTAVWPARPPVAAMPWTRIAALLAVLIACGLAGMFAWQQRAVTQEQRTLQELTQKLADAGYDNEKLLQLQRSCAPKCPAAIEQTVTERLQMVSAEAAKYNAAQNSAQLFEYIGSCRACLHRQQATERIQRADQAAADGRAKSAADAAQRNAQQEQRALDEEATFRNASGNAAALRNYMSVCQVCAFAGAARAEIQSLEAAAAAANARQPVAVPAIEVPSSVPDRTTNPSRPGWWTHNGSTMRLEADGASRRFYYLSPRNGLSPYGVSSGTLLFEGRRVGSQYVGTSHIFTRNCGRFPYRVSGPVSDDSRTVTMTGEAPSVGRNCSIVSTRSDTLVFEYQD